MQSNENKTISQNNHPLAKPLGIYGNNSATPEPQLLTKSKSLKEEKLKRLNNRVRTYQLKELSSTLLKPLKEYNRKKDGTKKAVYTWHCSKTPIPNSSQIDYVRGEKGKTYFAGLQHCGAYWVCPICAYKIEEKRVSEIYAALLEYRKKGYSTYMITLTLPHYISEDLNDNLKFLIEGFDFARSHRRIRRLKIKVPYLRSLEVTYGANGFHPHLHCVFLLKDKDAAAYLAAFKALWIEHIKKTGKFNRWVKDRAFKCDKWNESLDQLSDYMCKWKLSDEIAKGQRKKAINGYTPFQILELILDGKDWEYKRDTASVYQEYARKIKGKRMLSNSRGFYTDVEIEETEEEEILKDDVIDKILFSIDVTLYWELIKSGFQIDLVTAYDYGGLAAVHEVFNRCQLDYNYRDRKFILPVIKQENLTGLTE